MWFNGGSDLQHMVVMGLPISRAPIAAGVMEPTKAAPRRRLLHGELPEEGRRRRRMAAGAMRVSPRGQRPGAPAAIAAVGLETDGSRGAIPESWLGEASALAAIGMPASLRARLA